MTAAYVYAAIRTPFGKLGGGLAQIRPDDLAATVLTGLLAKTPGLDPGAIDEVVWGNANGAGEENRNVGRMAVLLAGLPTSVPGSTVNRLCASGLDAVIGAARAIAVGEADLVVAGGVESMTRAPWVVPKPSRAFPAGDAGMVSTTLGWRLVNPAMPEQWTVSLGEGAEILADEFDIDREAQDDFAVRSHHLAAKAWADGAYDAQVVTPEDVQLDIDEGVRPDASVESLAALKPVFRTDGTVTAGNASPLSDGAAAVLLASVDLVDELGLEPLARVRASGSAAVEPQRFGIAPVEATTRALARAGRSWADVDTVELNEAFSAQVLACLASWPELDPERVNPDGGAVAIGHPLGCSGARLTGAVAHRLARTGGSVGVASLCIGVGQGLTLVLER